MKASIDRTGLSSVTKSSRSSGNNVAWDRDSPATKRFIGTSHDQSWVEYSDSYVFTQPRPKTDITNGNVDFDYKLPIPLTLITSLATASFNIPRLASITVSQSRARVVPV